MYIVLLLLLIFSVPAERIEHERKIRVPLALQETLWSWLLEKFHDPSWLNQDDSQFYTQLGDELFSDYYFDTRRLDLMNQGHGIRHRSREVISGSAIEKDNRQLIQIKLGQNEDMEKLTRIEHKLDVVLGASPRTELLPNLVVSKDRDRLYTLLKEIGVQARELRPFLLLKQHRRRVYLSDKQGPYATLTLDLVTSTSWLSNVKWLEIELELNEIRYTESPMDIRQKMTQTTQKIEAELLNRFPDLIMDQTPKYDLGFQMVLKSSPLPVLWLVSLGITEENLSTIVLLLVLAATATLIFIVQKLRKK